MDEVKAEFEEVADIIRKELIEPIVDFGNPERLLGEVLKDDPNFKPLIKDGKLPYEVWSGNVTILQWLGQKYGPGPDTRLQKFIASKEIAKMYEMERGL